jgi:F420-dependent oxidoreductase-like protein
VNIGSGTDATTIDGFVEQVRQARDNGFNAVWVSNIFGLDAMTAIAVAGHEVDGIELGTFVVPTFPRHPAVMAQQALTTAAATGGRFTLGIGLSHQVVIESMWGLSFAKPARHMREYLSVLGPLLRDGQVSFKGEVFTVNATVDKLAPPPQVIIAALGPTMLEIAGTLADGTATWMTGPSTLASHIVPNISKAAAAAGKPAPRVVAGLPVCITNDPDAARGQAEQFFSIYGTLPSYRAMLDREGAAGPGDVAIVGDEGTVRKGIEQLADAGVTDFLPAPFGQGADRERTLTLLRELAAS